MPRTPVMQWQVASERRPAVPALVRVGTTIVSVALTQAEIAERRAKALSALVGALGSRAHGARLRGPRMGER